MCAHAHSKGNHCQNIHYRQKSPFTLYICTESLGAVWQRTAGLGLSTGWGGMGGNPSGLHTLALLLPPLQFPKPTRPGVPPLDDQAVLVGHQSWPVGGVFTDPHDQVLLADLDLGAFAGQVFQVDPQEVVTTLHPFVTALVDREDVDGELGPVGHRLHF